MPWQLELCGEVFRQDELGLQQYADIEKATGLRYEAVAISLDRHRLEARVLLEVGSCLLADRKGITLDAARKELGAMRPAEFEAAVSTYEDDTPTSYEDGFPQSADEPSTTT